MVMELSHKNNDSIKERCTRISNLYLQNKESLEVIGGFFKNSSITKKQVGYGCLLKLHKIS